MIRAYHFVGDTLRDGRPIPPDGEWLEESGELQICRKGLHASRHVADAVCFAPGNTCCLVELDGDLQEQYDKVCAPRRKIIARFDATKLLQADARASALSVIHLWDAPAIVKQFLETGDKSIAYTAANAAAYAANAAAYTANAAANAAAYAANAANAVAYTANAAANAAAYAANAAAYAANAAANAAYADSRKVNRERLAVSVEAKFRELGVL